MNLFLTQPVVNSHQTHFMFAGWIQLEKQAWIGPRASSLCVLHNYYNLVVVVLCSLLPLLVPYISSPFPQVCLWITLLASKRNASMASSTHFTKQHYSITVKVMWIKKVLITGNEILSGSLCCPATYLLHSVMHNGSIRFRFWFHTHAAYKIFVLGSTLALSMISPHCLLSLCCALCKCQAATCWLHGVLEYVLIPLQLWQ